MYGKTDRLHIPTNLPAIADLLEYARSVHARRGRRVWNLVFGNYVAKPAFLRGLRVFNFVLVPNPESRFQRETLNL
ncbi:MAG: hypothetical protein L6406_14275 [Desulfobacterales bacterium]|nr:hypothetical protein [Desulfobacterales bacterium]